MRGQRSDVFRARLMTIARDKLCRPETLLIAAIENGVSSLVEAREIIAAFQGMIRKKTSARGCQRRMTLNNSGSITPLSPARAA